MVDFISIDLGVFGRFHPNLGCELTSNGIIESLLGQVAGLVGSVQDLVVEDGEVQGETQADGVRGSELGLGDIGCALRKG